MAVVFLSDGEPSDGNAFPEAILAATQQPEKLRLEILKIGTGRLYPGTRNQPDITPTISRYLAENGAEYNAVSVQQFQTLIQKGIAHTIADDFSEESKEPKKP